MLARRKCTYKSANAFERMSQVLSLPVEHVTFVGTMIDQSVKSLQVVRVPSVDVAMIRCARRARGSLLFLLLLLPVT